jgi:hypothetical protein
MSKHNLLFLDFETYYDKDYSLKKMDPPCYILDPRWETIGCAFKVNDGVSVFVDAPKIASYLSAFDPATTTTVAFNALFDNCVLAWRYGFVPARMLCTMRMAVACFGHKLRRHSLAAIGEFLGVGQKGDTISQAAGLRRQDLLGNPGLWRAYQAYANNDNELSALILDRCLPIFPKEERKIMNAVLRCAVVPKFVIDTDMLNAHMADVRDQKIDTLIAAGADIPDRTADDTDERIEKFAKTIRSNPQFEQILKNYGVEVEYKHSATDPEREIPAFAKTDEFMSKLLEHDDPDVQALATCRLGMRSTIEESRGARLLSIANLPWQRYCGGNKIAHLLPIPLKYAGAHTHRLSGDWKMNMQNLPSGRGTKISKLRKALCAPDGYKVVVADKSQIECRMNAWFCGQEDLLDIFANKLDPYSVLASQIFGFPVDKNIHKLERFIGKNGQLGLGFGAAAPKFYSMVIRVARTMGMDIPTLLQVWTPDLAETSVKTYRTVNNRITAMWQLLGEILQNSWSNPHGRTAQVGPVQIGYGYVEGPSGLRMVYDDPHYEEGELWYSYAGRRHRMYGSKFLENIIQFLARINTMHDAIRIEERGFSFAMQSHDELAWVVREDQVEECQRVALEEMRRPPAWALSLPLDAECGKAGASYGDAK